MGMETKMFAEFPDAVTRKQLQQMLQISKNKAYSLLQNGEIRSKRVGSEYRIKKEEIIKYLEED